MNKKVRKLINKLGIEEEVLALVRRELFNRVLKIVRIYTSAITVDYVKRTITAIIYNKENLTKIENALKDFSHFLDIDLVVNGNYYKVNIKIINLQKNAGKNIKKEEKKEKIEEELKYI